ncbi:WD-40 repeat protein [Hydrogenimonas sp.]|nr:WD-40 repeat protein [Hydrogenimonas sp.]
MIIEKRLGFRHSITAIKALTGRRVAIADSSNAVRFFSLDPIALTDGFKTSLPLNDALLHGADISEDGKYVAFCVKKEGVAVFDGVSKRLLYRFKRHEGDVESLCISRKLKYLATGGQDGKTFLWSLSTGRMVASLPHHSDFVTTIAFSPNGQWIATGSYDRRIIVTNISSLSHGYRLRGHSKAVTELLFVGGHRLIAGDKDGEIAVWDYFGSKVIKRLKKMFDEVTALSVTPDERFLFAADKSGVVSLYDLNSYELVSLRYLRYSKPVKKLCYAAEGNHLVVGLADGEVTFNAPLKESRQMREYIESGDLESAYRLAEENPLLRYSDEYIELEALWSESFSKAMSLLELGKKEEAKKILEPFCVEASKRLLTQQLISDFSDFQKFKTAVQNRKYQLAYSMAAKYPMLKENRYYEMMEKEWNELFSRAKKLALQKGGEEKIKELLKPFRGISGKSVLIQALLSEREVYRLFMKLVNKRDFKAAIELAKRYPAIMELEEYKKIEKIADVIASRAMAELEDGNYAEAARLAVQLAIFPDMKERADELVETANLYASAMRYFSEKNYAAIYKILEQHPVLEETKIVRNLEEVWRKAVAKAEVAASRGDVAEIRRIFAPFITFPQKRAKIAALLKQAYLEQIESMLERGRGVESAIMRYIELFGMDDEMSSWLSEHGMRENFGEEAPKDIAQIDIKSLPESIAA